MPKIYDDEQKTAEDTGGSPKPGGHDDLGVHPERREAEIDSLNKSLDAPAISDAERRTNQSPSSDAATSEESDRLGQGFNEEKDAPSGGRFRGLFKRRKSIIALASGGIVGGGMLGIMTFMPSAPFVDIGWTLNRPSNAHSAAVESRIFGFTRAARAYKTGNIGETRVSYMGSRSFNALLDRVEQRHGFKFDTRWETGRPYRVTFDLPSDSPLRGANPDATRANIIRQFGLPEGQIPQLDGNNRTGSLLLRDLNAGQADRIIRNIVRLDNQSADKVRGKMHTAMRIRYLKQAWGVPTLFSPLERAAYTADQSARAWWEKRQERKGKQKSVLSTKYQAIVDSARNKIGPGKIRTIAGGLVLTGGLCILKEVGDDLPSLYYVSTVQPSEAEAIDAIAINSQMLSGNDYFSQQIADEAQALTDINGQSVWSAKAMDSLRKGGPGEGVDANGALKAGFSTRGGGIEALVNLLIQNSEDTTLIEAAAIGGDAFANVACSGPGYALQITAGVGLAIVMPGSLAVKGVQAAQSLLIMEIITGLMSDIVAGQVERAAENICGINGDGITVDAAKYGNCLAYGAMSVHNANAAAMGGVELSDTDQMALLSEVERMETEEFRSQSFATRLFDRNNPRSLVSTISHEVGARSTNIRNVSNVATSILTSPLSLFSNITSRAVAEPPSYDFGFPLVSIPLHIIENPRYNDPFENAEWVRRNLDNIDTDRARKCFGVDIREINGMLGATIEEQVVFQENDFANANCNFNDTEDEPWIRTALFVLDDSISLTTACYDGDATACAELDIEGTPPSAPGGPNVDGRGYAFPVGLSKADASNGYNWPCASICHHDGTPAFDLAHKDTVSGRNDSATIGVPVYAITGGEIRNYRSSYSGQQGCESLQLVGDDGWWYWYGHIQGSTQSGRVEAGEQIAVIGERRCTGNGSYPHLHIDRGCNQQPGGNKSCRDPGFVDIMNSVYGALE